MSWIDNTPPYPWKLKIASDLHRLLVDTYFEPVEIRDVINRSKVTDPSRIAFGRGAYQIWVDALDRIGAEGTVRDLLAYFVATGAPKKLRTFSNEILTEKEPPASAEPTGGAAGSMVPDASRDEALLMGDDLSESVGAIPPLMKAIESVMKWRRSVCRVLVTAKTGGSYFGTGTLISNGYVLTNHHVLHPDGSAASAVRVEFDYEDDDKGQAIASKFFDADPGTIKASQPDDWGVIKVANPPNDVTPLDLATLVGTAKAPQRAFILQHPRGNRKRLAFVRNTISSVEARKVFYLTDTEPGSSGSPVFDANGNIIALHRAGGTPIKYAGMQPVKKNEGVRLDVVAPDILAP
jgi:V8-like Glu-specific endopeptidase